jgi:hypothetical protein
MDLTPKPTMKDLLRDPQDEINQIINEDGDIELPQFDEEMIKLVNQR